MSFFIGGIFEGQIDFPGAFGFCCKARNAAIFVDSVSFVKNKLTFPVTLKSLFASVSGSRRGRNGGKGFQFEFLPERLA